MTKSGTTAALLVIATLTIASAARERLSGRPRMIAPAAAAHDRKMPLRPDPPGTINGAATPDNISDRAAYSILLRMLAFARSSDADKRTRAYVHFMRIGHESAGSCSDCPTSATTERDVDRLLSYAHDFGRRLELLDRKANELHKQLDSPVRQAQLITLRNQKNTLIDDFRTGMLASLGKPTRSAVQNFVDRRIKRKMKIIPENPPVLVQSQLLDRRLK